VPDYLRWMPLPPKTTLQGHSCARRPSFRLIASLPLLLLPLPLFAQGQRADLDLPQAGNGSEAAEHMQSFPIARAARTSSPITIDGNPNEAVWQTAPLIDGFIQLDPMDGAPVSQRTEVRILYDDDNLYIAAWLFDTGEIVTRLGRRDTRWTDTDHFAVFLDTFHDHRTAYRFTVNPSGVIRDEIITGGGSGAGGAGGRGGGAGGGGAGGGGAVIGTGPGDATWDPVWDTRSIVTGEGWFTEMRIPFGQMGFAPGEIQLWGLQFERRIGRNVEFSTWAYTPRVERSTVARFGHLEGISGIRGSSPLEVLPYLASRAEYREIPLNGSVNFTDPFRSGSDYFADAGVDLRYRIGSSLTLDATVNPDFGQVELDPAEINLTAFESRLGERRPFFVAGAEIFSFGGSGGTAGAGGGGTATGGGGTGGGSSQILYTRRIGRAPQVSNPGSAVYSDRPISVRILGAAKITGRTASGWSIGLLDVYTGSGIVTYVEGDGVEREAVVEPASNYFVARVRRDQNQGTRSIGGIITSIARKMDGEPTLTSRLHSSALTGGLDFRQDWDNRRWVLSAEVMGSYVRGDSAAIRLTQLSSARYFQRPNAEHLTFDPGATSLAGYGARVSLAKESGAWTGGPTFSITSPTLELNDIGFQNAADRIDFRGDFGYQQLRIGNHLRRWSLRAGQSSLWNFGGELLGFGANLSGNLQTLNFHGLNGRVSYSFPSWNDRLTRGGPLTRDPASYTTFLSYNSDTRSMTTVRLSAGLNGDEVGGRRWNGMLTVSVRPSEALALEFGPSIIRNRSAAQFVRTQTDALATHTGGTRYIFSTLEQTTVSMEVQASLTFSPTLTLEVSAEPFLGSGKYGGFKELAGPRTFDFLEYGRDSGTISRSDETARYTVDPDGSGPGGSFSFADPNFNLRSLIGSAVLRWEWRPGSTFYAVWQQNRSGRVAGSLPPGSDYAIGDFRLSEDLQELFRVKAENVLMLKVSYWINP